MKSFIRRFEEKFIKKEEGCWEWTASKNKFGYGQIRAFGKVHKAHRISYELYVEDIPAAMDVCHTCDNRGCVNPEHLFLGTAQDNVNDMIRKNRQQWIGGRKLTEQQVIAIMDEKGLYREIGKKYGVTETQISRIKNGHTWKHITT